MAKKLTKKETPVMIVASKMKEYAKGYDVRVGGEFVEALNFAVADMVEGAVRRCKGNNRSTLRPDDL